MSSEHVWERYDATGLSDLFKNHPAVIRFQEELLKELLEQLLAEKSDVRQILARETHQCASCSHKSCEMTRGCRCGEQEGGSAEMQDAAQGASCFSLAYAPPLR